MSNVQSYNALIDRFKAFASGHFILKTFSHGQIDTADLEKFTEYPFMHVVPSNVTYAKGTKTFSFQIVLADLPRDKDDKVEFQREVLSDLQRIAEDLVAEITNHRVLFGDLITVQNVSLEPFLEEFHNTLTGWTISLELLVPYYWDACSIPAEWNTYFEGGSSGGESNIFNFAMSIEDTNGQVTLVNDEETPAANHYYGTNAEGVRGWYLTTDNIGLTCETIGDCQTIIDIEAAIDALEEEILLKADISSISAVGFSNDYNDLDNKPTIPAAQVNSDWNATSGVAEILNKPTIPSIAGLATVTYVDQQDALKVDKVAGKGLSTNDFTNTLKTKLDGIQAGAEVNVNADWNATSGDAQILNKPTLTNGTVTSVGVTAGTGISVSGSPITSSGSITVTNSAPDQVVALTAGSGIAVTGTYPNFTITNNAPSGGTVTSVTATAPMSSTGGATPNLSMSSANGTTNGYLLSSDWLIFNGKFNTPTGTTLQYVRGDGSLATFPAITSGTVTSVGLTMPSAFNVASSPVTTSGTLAVTGAGTVSEYVRGDGSLATFPTIPVTSGFVPYTGATTDVDLGTHNLTADHIALNVNPSGAGYVVGATQWNNTIGSSETLLKGGTVSLKNGVDLVARVVNKVTPNTTLTKAAYQAVRVSGAQGQRLAVEFAQANNDNNSADTIGIVCETIATNQEGFIQTVGQLEDINTTGSLQGETWIDGDVLYLSPTTAGALTNIKPTGATGHIVVMGYVEYAHASSGKIYVKIMNGWELDELHNVYITSPTDNQALIYESASSLWKNETVDKTFVGLGNVDNTSDANKPISTDTQTALNAKQDTLTLTTTGTSGAATLTGATLNIPQYSGGGASGGANTPVKLGSGGIYSNIPIGASATSSSLNANAMYLAPFIPAQTFTISDFKINVTLLGTGNYRILLYSHSDTNGLPDVLLYESSDLSVTTLGVKTATTTQTFTAGTTYWLGVYGSSTVQFSGVVIASQNQIGVDSTLTQYTNIFRSATFGSAPNPFGTTHTKTANTFTRIGLTVA